MQPEPLAVGTRVIYRDPAQPSLPLAGAIAEITEAAVHVQYDGYPDDSGKGLIARGVAGQVLIPEAEYYRDRFAIRPTNAVTS